MSIDILPGASQRAFFTEEGGLAVKMTNKTGAAAVKGSLLSPASTDNGVELTAADGYDCIGVMYSDGPADGAEVWVIISGRAQVLLKDTTASTAGNWVETSDTPGRANASAGVPQPPTADNHFQEIGHCIESKTAGADVLAYVMLHFN